MHFVEGAVAGFAVGVFAPGVARKVKALWVEYTNKAKAAVKSKV